MHINRSIRRIFLTTVMLSLPKCLISMTLSVQWVGINGYPNPKSFEPMQILVVVNLDG